jgi:GTPase SAR1 family protein
MNHSISTMTGKTKIKIVFLGSQNVGKSSIIERYVNNRFEEAANVPISNTAHRRYRFPGQKYIASR